MAFGTCSAVPTARPYRFTRQPSGVVCGKTTRPPCQSRAWCGQVPGAAYPTPSCCASASGMPRWRRYAAPRLPGRAAWHAARGRARGPSSPAPMSAVSTSAAAPRVRSGGRAPRPCGSGRSPTPGTRLPLHPQRRRTRGPGHVGPHRGRHGLRAQHGGHPPLAQGVHLARGRRQGRKRTPERSADGRRGREQAGARPASPLQHLRAP